MFIEMSYCLTLIVRISITKMKWVIVAIFLILGLVQADDALEKRGVLRRTTRQALGSMGGAMLVQTEKNIILNCKNNGLSQSGATELQNSYDTLKSCLGRRTIFIATKDEFIDNIVDCSQDAIQKTKKCLTDEQKYFPDFILELVKSMVNFMYDDKDLFKNNEVVRCINNLSRYTVLMEYVNCLQVTSARTHDDQNIPKSKAEFCSKFVPAVECFPDTLKNHCSDTSNNNKFLKDYRYAMEHPCDSKDKVTFVSESNKL